MGESKLDMFRNRLSKVHRHYSRQAKRLGITCYRIYDHDIPEFPFCMEIYEDCVYLAEYKRRHGLDDEQHGVWIEECINVVSDVLKARRENIYVKLRQRKQGRTGQYRKMADNRNEILVNENGLRFYVNLSDYLDTGLFLDHRLTRQMTREIASGKKVLNLFSYTGSFSVYAAAGGADEVTTVDLSNTYISWAKKNMGENGFNDQTKFKFVQADVINFLKKQPANSYDLIILDPPTFSNSKRMDDVLDIQRDHSILINDCLRILKKGGIIFFSTNYRGFKLDTDRIYSKHISDITGKTTPFDFAGRLNRYCFKILKEL